MCMFYDSLHKLLLHVSATLSTTPPKYNIFQHLALCVYSGFTSVDTEHHPHAVTHYALGDLPFNKYVHNNLRNSVALWYTLKRTISILKNATICNHRKNSPIHHKRE